MAVVTVTVIITGSLNTIVMPCIVVKVELEILLESGFCGASVWQKLPEHNASFI